MIDRLRHYDLAVVQYLVHQVENHQWFAVLVYFLADMAILSVIPVLVWLWYCGRPARFRPSGKKSVVLALLTVVFTVAVKTVTAMIVFRQRPFITDPALQGAVSNSLIDPQSFPSGHTMLVAAIAFSVLYSGYRKMGVFLCFMMVLVAFGRVAAGVHYPTDVVAGALVGWAIAWALHHGSSSLKDYLPDS